MYNTKAYSAASATSPLISASTPRRDPTRQALSRRDFLANTALIAAALTVGPSCTSS
ncbi:MAG: twin-arginine translocation signal domain-containing protein, partial [Nostoc sp.]